MLGAPPATTSTLAPGRASSGGTTVRHASGRSSLQLATASGSMSCGSGTSMASACGTRTVSLSAPPQSLPTTAPNPYIKRRVSTKVRCRIAGAASTRPDEALSRLPTELAARNVLVDDRRRGPACFAGLGHALGEDRFHHVEADQVGALEHSHRPAQPVAHRDV